MTHISSQASGKPFLNPVRVIGWSLIAVLLAIPAVAMRFIHEVNWTTFDFLVAGALLISAGLAFELLFWRARGLQLRLALGLAILAVVLFVWAQGAVGIF
jgi:hypothetical protein